MNNMNNIKVDIGEIDYKLLKTDEDIRNEAKKKLNHVLVGIGEELGKKTWNAIENNKKTLFVRKAGQEYKKTATLQCRKNTEDMIFQTIKEMKQQFEAKDKES